LTLKGFCFGLARSPFPGSATRRFVPLIVEDKHFFRRPTSAALPRGGRPTDVHVADDHPTEFSMIDRRGRS
jgi:hypothetical protein